MASTFQNRLVGVIVLVAVGIIVLLSLLDGDKKYNENEFAAIPIIPKPGDEQGIEDIAPLTQTVTSGVKSEAMLSEAISEKREAAANSVIQDIPNVPAEQFKKLVLKPEPKSEVQAPQGKAFVVQLGALKNSAKVEEIVAKLRLSGYQVYTVPSRPVNGQLTRIFVGPEVSRQRLEVALPKLRSITGLQVETRAFKP